MLRIFMFLLCSFFVQSLFAQVDLYVPGYIINDDGQQQTGFLNQDKDELLVLRVLFKTNFEQETPEKFLSGELKEFGFQGDGRRFLPIKYTYVPRSGAEEVTEDRMAELLTEGTIDLFRLERKSGEYFSKYQKAHGPTSVLLIGEKDGVFHRLETTEREVTETTIRVVETYKGYLRYMMQDWADAERQIKKLKLLEGDVRKLVNEYNRFHDPSIEEEARATSKSMAKIQHRLLAFGGPSMRIASKDVSSSFVGVGYALVFESPRQSNALRVSVGPELIQAFNDPIPGFSQRGRPEYFIRLGITADYLLRRQGKVLPYLRGIVSPIVVNAFRYGDVVETSFPLGDLSIGLGGGVDIGRLSLNVQYDRHFGLYGGVAYRLF